MGHDDDPTFFLYGIGYPPEQLCLGNLVFGSYATPTTVRHCSIGKLSEEDFKIWAWASEISGCFTSTSGNSFGIGTEVLDLVNLGLSFANSRNKTIMAQKGRRIVLKDPQKFFAEKVLENEVVKAKLKLWLSAANGKYMLKKMGKFFRKPKIWFATGLYELEDVKALVVHGNDSSLKMGISSAAIAALSGVPVGGSVTLDPKTTIKAEFEMKGRNIWATQYQRVDVQYIRTEEWQGNMIPSQIQLHHDTTRLREGVREKDDKKPNGVEVKILDVDQDVEERMDEGSGNDEWDEKEEAYWEALKVAEERIQRHL